MSAEDEERFQSINKCWICDKLFDNKVSDQFHITRKYRCSAHWSCNLGLTKKVHLMFHNLGGYDSHLIMQEVWCKNKCYAKWIRKIHGFYKW